MRRNLVETVLGAIVLAVAAVFVVFAVQTGDVGTVAGYRLTANFVKAGGRAFARRHCRGGNQ